MTLQRHSGSPLRHALAAAKVQPAADAPVTVLAPALSADPVPVAAVASETQRRD
jgi:hypothetical protein